MSKKDIWVRVLPVEVPVPNLLNDVPVAGNPPCDECPDAEMCERYLEQFGCGLCGGN